MKTGTARVLVVDDDPAMLRTVERILAPRHEVHGFSSGEEAIEAAKREEFDVAIVDVRMPGLDGFEVTRAIKALRPRTEVVLVTGSVTDLDDKLVRAIEERAFYFITKPFSKAVLTSLVAWCLDMQRLAAERNDLIRRLTEDLERARRFQRALLPQGLPKNFGTIRAASAWVSCETVGGDLYDVVPLGEDRLFVMVADVAGHGVPAALLVGMIKTAVGRVLSENTGRERIDLAPAARAVLDILEPLNVARVVTALFGIVDVPGRTLHYLNAGHPPGALWKPGEAPRLLAATTPLLSHGIGLSKNPTAIAPFAPGERLAIYSDGLYEVRDPSGNEFGRDRLLQVLTGGKGAIEDVVQSAMKQTDRHAGGRPPEDDLTLLVLESGRG
ncbi:MAG TPA: SpoIIE family protein phosphatase [Candidatus Polarisedimenticolia bacterium]|nr:SpoIIE family protein phosphatase [Candidatus Polarisedimenticolia bacterium]